MPHALRVNITQLILEPLIIVCSWHSQGAKPYGAPRSKQQNGQEKPRGAHRETDWIQRRGEGIASLGIHKTVTKTET